MIGEIEEERIQADMVAIGNHGGPGAQKEPDAHEFSDEKCGAQTRRQECPALNGRTLVWPEGRRHKQNRDQGCSLPVEGGKSRERNSPCAPA